MRPSDCGKMQGITGFELPKEAEIGGKKYSLHTDFRVILQIFSYLEDPDLPEFIRWQVALHLFYGESLPDAYFQEGADFFARFVSCGQEDSANGPKLLDWEKDAQLIIADVNKVAGREIRELPEVHWWTFLSWFHGIGEGQLSTVVSIRQKRAEGKKLSDWEADFCRRNKALVDLPIKLSREEKEEKERLMGLLRSN